MKPPFTSRTTFLRHYRELRQGSFVRTVFGHAFRVQGQYRVCLSNGTFLLFPIASLALRSITR